MTDRIERLLKRVEEFHPGTAAELEEFRIKVLLWFDVELE